MASWSGNNAQIVRYQYFLKTRFIIIAINNWVRYQTITVSMEVLMYFSLDKRSNFIPMGGVSDRSNFGPNGGHECRGGAIGDLMGGDAN
jgi:hypothetical protein